MVNVCGFDEMAMVKGILELVAMVLALTWHMAVCSAFGAPLRSFPSILHVWFKTNQKRCMHRSVRSIALSSSCKSGETEFISSFDWTKSRESISSESSNQDHVTDEGER